METTQQTGLQVVTERKGELAIASMAAKARAEVEARFAIALNRKRIINDVRVNILESCKRLAFAHGAIYRKPVGKGTVDGFSIRFAEEAIKSMGNISVETMTIYEDDERRTMRITVTDLETNSTYGDEVVIAKTVERRQLKEGQTAISQRKNSYGETVFLVQATDDDLTNRVNAMKSKAIRNSGLRLVPQDILEEAWDQIQATCKGGGKDPQADTKKLCDAFNNLGIKPSELERYLSHPISSISPKELTELRGIYTALNEEETSWAAVMESKGPKKPVSDPIDVAATVESGASAIDASSIPNPYEWLAAKAKEDGVTEAQIHAWMKSEKLAGEKTMELQQATDGNMRKVIGQWAKVLPAIRKAGV